MCMSMMPLIGQYTDIEFKPVDCAGTVMISGARGRGNGNGNEQCQVRFSLFRNAPDDYMTLNKKPTGKGLNWNRGRQTVPRAEMQRTLSSVATVPRGTVCRTVSPRTSSPSTAYMAAYVPSFSFSFSLALLCCITVFKKKICQPAPGAKSRSSQPRSVHLTRVVSR